MTANVVLLSTADFDSAVWTNKQHLAVGLAASTDVVFIESMGLRRPGLNLADGRRILRALSRRRTVGVTGRPAPPQRMRIVSPKVLPLHGARLARAVNAGLVRRHLLPQIDIGPDSVLWTFSPLTYGLDRRAGRVVYHSVDLLHTASGVPAAAILAAERQLLEVADVVIASSIGVRDHLHAQGRGDVLLWENVADVELFRAHRGARAPRAIFGGNLTPTKVDFQLLRAVADAGVPVALAGPIAVDGAGGAGRVESLLAHPGVSYLGNLRPAELATEVCASTVGLVPYLVNQHTAGVFPMKVYEYLAAGLDVVSTELASLRGKNIHGLQLAAAEAYPGAVLAALAGFTEVAAERRSAESVEHSWSERIRQAQSLLQAQPC